MRDDDQAKEGRAGSEIEPLRDAIAVMLPDRYSPFSRRRLQVQGKHELSLDELDAATSVLHDLQSDPEVDIAVVLKLFERLDITEPKAEELRSRVIAHVERRWSQFSPHLATHAAESHSGHKLLKLFPRLQSDPRFLRQFATIMVEKKWYAPRIVELLSNLCFDTLQGARILIEAARRRGDQDVSTAVFFAIARSFGWTPWVSLMAILHSCPDYADPGASFEIVGDPRVSKSDQSARLAMAKALEPQTQLRGVADMLLELTPSGGSWSGGSLFDRPAETRAAYVESLKALVGNDEQLRTSTIEALLWLPTRAAADLAQFAASVIAEAEDREFLIDLEQHCVRMVRYGARAVRAARFGDRLVTGELPTPRALVQSIAALDTVASIGEEPARTWLGDRNIERLIESTIARVEAKVAEAYEDHGDEGEDRLLATLFAELAVRFSDLDAALEAMARAASAPHRAAISMRYRNVDRPEEGTEGIKGAKRFSADLCLIIDPMLDGTSLGRRVTLVQAKRLYRNKKAVIQPAWDRSYRLDREQRLALQRQTHSSVYFFHAPPLGGRGVPVIPTQLVADLSEHGGTGTSLRREVVAAASRSLSDWLTYDALALRVGDPCAELAEKAEGEPGGLPRALLQIPTVEVDIALVPRSEDAR